MEGGWKKGVRVMEGMIGWVGVDGREDRVGGGRWEGEGVWNHSPHFSSSGMHRLHPQRAQPCNQHIMTFKMVIKIHVKLCS